MLEIQEERKILPFKIYRHFKGKFYATMGIVTDLPRGLKTKEILSERNTFICHHTETEEMLRIVEIDGSYYIYQNSIMDNVHDYGKLVLYKSLYDGHIPFVRPYDMFISEVDIEKYPEVTQYYRMEQVYDILNDVEVEN